MSKHIDYQGSLAYLYPFLLEEWDYEKNTNINLCPEQISPKSHRKANWKCKQCGREWETEIRLRTAGSSCQCTKGNKISAKKQMVKPGNSLQNCFPEIAAEWHPALNGNITQADVNSGSSNKFWWRCRKGHEWTAQIANRTGQHTGCPRCDEENHTSFREQAVLFYLSSIFRCESRAQIDKKEVDIYIPEINVGIEYDGRYYHPKEKQESEIQKDEYLKSVGIIMIRIKEADINAVDGNCIFYKYSNSNYNGFEWAIERLAEKLSASIDINVERDQNEIISQYIKLQKEKSLLVKYPQLAKEWDVEANKGISADLMLPGSHIAAYWRCPQKHLYKAAINSRVRYFKEGKTYGCQYCSGHKVLEGFNDLQTKYPFLIAEWDYVKNKILPSEISAGSNRKIWWKCSDCGHTWEASPHNRANGRGCPECKNKSISQKLIKKERRRKHLQTDFQN